MAGWQIPPTTDGMRMFVPASMQPLPEEKAKYDAMIASARAGSQVSEPEGKKDLPVERDAAIHASVVTKDDASGDRAEEFAAKLAEHERLLQEHEPKIARRVKRVMRDYLLATRSKLRSVVRIEQGAAPDFQKLILTEQEVEQLLAHNEQNWREELRKAAEKPFAALWDASATAAFVKIASDGTFMSSTHPQALEFLRDKLVNLSEGSMSTLAVQVRRTIIKVLAGAPESAVRLEDAIRETLHDLEDQVEAMIDHLDDRSLLIARTEAAGIAGASQSMQWRELGIERHTWITAQDERVRHSHQTLNGKTVRIGDSFGFNLRWPGDPQASVEQVAACRCDTMPEPNQ